MNDRNTLYNSNPYSGDYDATELMAGTGLMPDEHTHADEQLMNPGSGVTRSRQSGGYASQTVEDRGYTPHPAPRPQPRAPQAANLQGSQQHFPQRPAGGTGAQGGEQHYQQRSPEGMRTHQHVDHVPGKKPGFLESIRANLVPVAFVGVGIGLLLNRNRQGTGEQEIRTTVRSPENGFERQNAPRPGENGRPAAPSPQPQMRSHENR